MSFKKTANAQVADLISLNAWEKMHGNRAFGTKTARSVQKLSVEQSKFLLSHCTIMSSVMTEEDPFDHLIKPETSHLVNNNDDAWSNEVIRLSYKTFVGAFNFLEHFQSSQAAKGHILDAVLRKVKIAPDVHVFYVDILVATDFKHESLIADIRANKMRYMSMGCTTDLVVCSYCGAHCTDQSTFCEHLERNKGEFLIDDEGIPRRVAELCGHKSLPGGGVAFVEASWVGTPAFPGAANRSVVMDGWMGPKTPYTHVTASTKVSHDIHAGGASIDQAIRQDFDRAIRDAHLKGRIRS